MNDYKSLSCFYKLDRFIDRSISTDMTIDEVNEFKGMIAKFLRTPSIIGYIKGGLIDKVNFAIRYYNRYHGCDIELMDKDKLHDNGMVLQYNRPRPKPSNFIYELVDINKKIDVNLPPKRSSVSKSEVRYKLTKEMFI